VKQNVALKDKNKLRTQINGKVTDTDKIVMMKMAASVA
jgi:hypothetical protein